MKAKSATETRARVCVCVRARVSVCVHGFGVCVFAETARARVRVCVCANRAGERVCVRARLQKQAFVRVCLCRACKRMWQVNLAQSTQHNN